MVQRPLCTHIPHVHVVRMWDILAGSHLSWTLYHATLSPAQTWLSRQGNVPLGFAPGGMGSKVLHRLASRGKKGGGRRQ